MDRRKAPELLHLLNRKIADPNGANLSRVKDAQHRQCGFLKGRARIRPMDLIDTNMIDFEPPQRILDLADDPCAARIAGDLAILPLKANLRCDNRLRAQTAFGNRLADDLFGTAKSVDGSGVDEIDA